MKNFLRNMASLIIAVAMNMAALIIVIAMSMTALIIVVAMVALFVAVVWMNRWFLIKKAIVIELRLKTPMLASGMKAAFLCNTRI